MAWRNLKVPVQGSGFVSSYIDTAFNDCLFLWDSVFILRFGAYARRAFDFQQTLDNFYAKQHRDGFICREVRCQDGSDQWHRSCPSGAGPNVLAWAEWLHFETTGDHDRLAKVFYPIAAYHQWTRKNRTWPDGSYWTTGLGSGMDNMTRVPHNCDVGQEHAWMTWADATFQAILSGRTLARMAEALGLPDEIEAGPEAEALAAWANENLWDTESKFYFDRNRDGALNHVKSVAGFWALLAGTAIDDRLQPFVDHLSDPMSFGRHHQVPSLAADAIGYNAEAGDYWCGAIWTPTNYMILRGLSQVGQDDLAYKIAANHVQRVLEVFTETGTFWENYAPERSAPGNPAKADFIGWSGLPPIAVLLEYIFGLRPKAVASGQLVWDIRLVDEFGVDQYPFGPKASLSVHCAARASEFDEPQVTVRSDEPIEVEVRWKGGSKIVRT